MMTFADLAWRHARERADLARDALERNDWSLTHAAAELDVTPTALRGVIVREPPLFAEYTKHNPGRGRPRK